MKIIGAEQTALLLPFVELVPAIAQVAKEMANGELIAPERSVINIDDARCVLIMPAVGVDIGIVKLITVNRYNSATMRPIIQGELIVFDTATGDRYLLLDGSTVTARRTAAVTLLGIQMLSQKKPASVLLYGTGVQARIHAQALIEYFDVSYFDIVGTSLEKSKNFVEHLKASYPHVEARPRDSYDQGFEIKDVDVVIALTTSKQPVIPAELPAHVLAIGVGAFRPDMVEIPEDLLCNRRIVVDYLPGAKQEAGDLMRANINWLRVSEISQEIDRKPFQNTEATVFKTVGHACWDLAAARIAVSKIRNG